MQPKHRVLIVTFAVLLGACVTPSSPPPTEPKAPPTNAQPGMAERAEAAFQSGLTDYASGQLESSATYFREALRLGLTQKKEEIEAHKYLAFIECSLRHMTTCREEFQIAFSLDPDFELSRSEAGHPMWGPVYKKVRQEVLRTKKR